MISSSGHRAHFKMNHPIVIYARKVLNGLLLDRAVKACTAVQSRVTHVNTEGARARITVGGEEKSFDFVVLAAGARNQLLPETTALGTNDLEITLGYFVPAEADIIKIKFLKRIRGLHLVLPARGPSFRGHLREDGTELQPAAAAPPRKLHRGRRDSHAGREPLQPRAALASGADDSRPPYHRTQLGDGGRCGRSAWDLSPAKGFMTLCAPAISGQALVEGALEKYPERLRAAFSADLEFAASLARKLFRGNFLGGAITTPMVQLVTIHRRFAS